MILVITQDLQCMVSNACDEFDSNSFISLEIACYSMTIVGTIILLSNWQ